MFSEIKGNQINNNGVGHALIESDNLIALEKLQINLKEQVDVIYIDPPYNTKRKNFTYQDRLERQVWLDFMRKRLELA